MKIEKINDNQLRCFITKEELAARKMKISELAYGTEKARGLFREMMRYASKNFGFESDDLPLMIEAIPLSPDIMLVTVTKIAFPDELDSRFAYFSESDFEESLSKSSAYSPDILYSDGFGLPTHSDAVDILKSASDTESDVSGITRHFVFDDMDTVISACKLISGIYRSPNSLYKDSAGSYHLILEMGMHRPDEFNRVCNCLCEFGIMQEPDTNSFTRISEHGKLIARPDAVGALSML